MADNYLEHRMDDYRSGRLAPRRAASHTAPVAPASPLSLTPCRVFIDTGRGIADVAAMVRRFRDAGCRVAFTLRADDSHGNTLAQETGARYYPSRLADRADTDYGAFEVRVSGDAVLTVTVSRDGRSAANRIATSAETPSADIADVCLLLSADRAILLDNLQITL